MIKGKTKTGFEYEISDDRLNNYELLELLEEVDEKPMIVPRVVKLLLGKDLANGLKEHVRTPDGIVPADKILDELQGIFEGQNDVKKSESSPK